MKLTMVIVMVPSMAIAEANLTALKQEECSTFTYLYETPSSDVSAGSTRSAHSGLQLFYNGMMLGAAITLSKEQSTRLVSAVRKNCKQWPTLPFAVALQAAVGEVMNPE